MNETELKLVIQALTCSIGNCVEWHNDKTAHRIRKDPELKGLTPEAIKTEVRNFVRAGGKISQVIEKRAEYVDEWEFYYKAIILDEDPNFPHGIFVEMRLADPDPEMPMIWLVNAHPQRR